nr:hypothetical protein BaRGS_003125 [Batillaria attramentaria]
MAWAWRVVLDAGFLRVCPLQPHFLRRICLATGSCPARGVNYSYKKAAPSVLCPEIATPPGPVITIENVDSLNLSSYDRDPGTVVRVSCLTTPEYRLVGVSSLTCLDDGTWNSEIPACEPNINNPTMTGTSSGDPADISMVPLIVLVSILGVIFLAFVGVMVFVTCFWRRAG